MTTACGSGDSSGDGSGGGGEVDTTATLRAGWTVGPNSLDPHMAVSEVASFRFGINAIYDRLFTITSAGEVEGMLVDSWEYSPDGQQLTMQLREDASFRDGTPLDAPVVKVNLDRARTLNSPVVKGLMEPVTEVAASGPYEVTLTLSSPTDLMPYQLAGMSGLIMHPDLIANGDPNMEANGSGAYSVESWAPGEKLVLVRDRDDYWDADAAQVARIEHTAIADFQAFTNAVAGGQIDIGQFQPGNVAAVEGRSGLNTVPVPMGIGTELMLNWDYGPLSDVRVRQALNYALDREAVTEALFPGSDARWQYSREGLPGFDSGLEERYPYDPARAKELLAEAGFPDGVDLGRFIISNAVTPGLTDVIKEQFEQSGIRFEPNVMDSLEGMTTFAGGEAPAYLNFSSYGLGFAAGMVTRSGATQNPAGPTPEYDRLFAGATDSRRSAEEREASAVELNDYLVEEAWGVPMTWVTYPWVMSDKVGNFSADMDYATTWGPYDFRYLTVSE
ncbi:ABC transporter substrate-binding protein [Rhodococcus artemisiae]|uniref:ABC transporter substrate-binding protein n=1 Tax=Rhodococcus artemisiae TaxID=714159 RepID=A0ABU7L6M9_9NOCA|nr:ABC transporter substrate-binding protein [Rhodococcus artemisiae]MEE2057201.1 ABC transporter substrate-binding protein [Rhodococcus artemisiae]